MCIRDRLTSVEYDLTVGKAKFDQLAIGTVYSECFYVGGFGILYRWRNVPLTTRPEGDRQ